MRLIWLGLIGGKHPNKVEQDPIVYQLYISCFSSQPSAFPPKGPRHRPCHCSPTPETKEQQDRSRLWPLRGRHVASQQCGCQGGQGGPVAPGVAMVAMSFPFQKSLVIHMSRMNIYIYFSHKFADVYPTLATCDLSRPSQ